MKAYYSFNNVGMVIECGVFWRVFNGYTKKQAFDIFKKEYRAKIGAKRLPVKMTLEKY